MYDVRIMQKNERQVRVKRSGKGTAPTKRLPTSRIAFPKQLDLLRAWVAASDQGIKAVDNADVARIARMASATISLANSFFADVGFLVRGGGGYTPDKTVIAFSRVHQWDAEKAGSELASLLRNTWFGELLLPRLQFAPMSEDDALIALGNEAGAGPAYRPQVRTLLDYLETAFLIVRENGQVRRGGGLPVSTPPTSPKTPTGAGEREDKAAGMPPQPSGGLTQAAPAPRLPLLVQGLLEQLPTSGSWNRREADDWLELARLTFNVVYKIPPEKGRVGERD